MAWIFNKKKETKFGYINGRSVSKEEIEELGVTTTELVEEKLLDTSLFNGANLVRSRLYGTGEMYEIHTDVDNYLYKPAVKKYTDIQEPFRGIVQECGYEVQKIVDPDTAVLCRYFNVDDIAGSIQLKVPVSDDSKDYRRIQRQDPMNLSKDEIDQFMREMVTDFLLCNYDAHGGNFIVDKNGVIRGVDKEQSFRYMNEEPSIVPDLDYSPNSQYGEMEPIYHTIFRQYSENKLDIDLGVIDKYISRVEKFDNDEYRKIFEPYCLSLKPDVEEANKLLDKIVDRKKNVRLILNTLTSEMTERRETAKAIQGGTKK